MNLKSLSRLWTIVALPLVGCAQPKGPILGDWNGFQPLSTPQGQVAIELVMYGKPRDTSGRMRVYKQMEWTEGNAADTSDHLSGTWTARDVTVNGRTWRNYKLSGLNTVFPTYVLTSNNYLVPALSDGSPDPGESGWGCCRLAPRPKNSFGYGRP